MTITHHPALPRRKSEAAFCKAVLDLVQQRRADEDQLETKISRIIGLRQWSGPKL